MNAQTRSFRRLPYRYFAVVVFAMAASCASPTPRYPGGDEIFYQSSLNSAQLDYKISPADKLEIYVLHEPDLSRTQVPVELGGAIQLPLLGRVNALGLTSSELSDEIQGRLKRYLKSPQVTVIVTTPARQYVVVEGGVNAPGVYEVPGAASLLEVIARAKSTTRTAALKEVVVFRLVNGERVGALFDLSKIRKGLDPDPTLLPGDKVVVGFSFVKGAFRDFLTAAPAIAVFRPY